jgi:hypothetical protein
MRRTARPGRPDDVGDAGGAATEYCAANGDRRGPDDRLATRHTGHFSVETVQGLLADSYRRLAATARVHTHLVVPAERFTAERLDALAHVPGAHRRSNSRNSPGTCGWSRSDSGGRGKDCPHHGIDGPAIPALPHPASG